MVIVDKIKILLMAHFLACKKTNYVVYEFLRLLFLIGMLSSSTTFREPFSKKIDTTLKFSTTSHPQTGGQIEVTNRSLGNLIR